MAQRPILLRCVRRHILSHVDVGTASNASLAVHAAPNIRGSTDESLHPHRRHPAGGQTARRDRRPTPDGGGGRPCCGQLPGRSAKPKPRPSSAMTSWRRWRGRRCAYVVIEARERLFISVCKACAGPVWRRPLCVGMRSAGGNPGPQMMVVSSEGASGCRVVKHEPFSTPNYPRAKSSCSHMSPRDCIYFRAWHGAYRIAPDTTST